RVHLLVRVHVLRGVCRGDRSPLLQLWWRAPAQATPRSDVKGSRLEDRLDAVYAIGDGPGANRVGYSPEEDEAHRLAAGSMEERGCVGSQARVRHGSLPGAYVELHHEQGPRLALAGSPLAVVTGIVGYVRGERVVDGAAGHAGTTPMDARDDALVHAAEEILR